jgi:hypothetical protein
MVQWEKTLFYSCFKHHTGFTGDCAVLICQESFHYSNAELHNKHKSLLSALTSAVRFILTNCNCKLARTHQ